MTTSIQWVVPNQGVSNRIVFLSDFSMTQPILGTGGRPIGSETQRYAAGYTRTVLPDGHITLLTTTLTEAQAIAAAYANYPIARLIDPDVGLDYLHRAVDQIQITPIRIGDKIRRWQLSYEVIAQ